MSESREQVGVRELRQNLSRYLERVRAGEAFEVTERNRPVAVLAPLAGETTATGRLVAAGRGTAPTRDLLDVESLPVESLPEEL
ncbi:type II toxin-antitoxin system Phd/YefM family antitoxin [Rubrobacter indicoceani]|uniref:type II toxin-antitoxin system Phd/YefM family antitoxin n=1 Tax=Rubrobacter indicoceani TaxID=2051957 RepID=UPI000E5BD12C|nr:type II toxin-antitoxin system prevent-host-death family antitoxin [Rubrobacter indicoceani]